MFTRKFTPEEVAIIERVIMFVRDKHIDEPGHDYSHVLEVFRWSIEIGKRVKDPVDPFITLCGALLHEIGRVNAPDGRFHGFDGASRAEMFLRSLSNDYVTIGKILRVIVRHTPTSHLPPELPEEKVVYDADAIERFGLMGMLRGIMNKKGSMEYVVKDRIKGRLADYDRLYYNESRELAIPYYKETREVVKMLEKALEQRLLSIDEVTSYCDLNEFCSRKLPHAEEAVKH